MVLPLNNFVPQQQQEMESETVFNLPGIYPLVEDVVDAYGCSEEVFLQYVLLKFVPPFDMDYPGKWGPTAVKRRLEGLFRAKPDVVLKIGREIGAVEVLLLKDLIAMISPQSDEELVRHILPMYESGSTWRYIRLGTGKEGGTNAKRFKFLLKHNPLMVERLGTELNINMTKVLHRASRKKGEPMFPTTIPLQ